MEDKEKATTTKTATRADAPASRLTPARPPQSFIVQLADLLERFREHLAQMYITAAKAQALHDEALSTLTEIRERYPEQKKEAEKPHSPPDDGAPKDN